MAAGWRISRAFLVFIALYLLLPSALAVDFSYCKKKGKYSVKITGIEIMPYPVLSGKRATFNVSASTHKTIFEGKVEVLVSYFGTTLYSETRSLCKQVSCPIFPGRFFLSRTKNFASYTAPGPYHLIMTIKGKKDDDLTCINFDINIELSS